MLMQEQEIEFDVYYQGSTSELYALLYPLGGPNSPIFQHLTEQKVTIQPQSKQLTYTYSPQNFENIDKQKQQIKYTSKPVQNLSNYFYSTFHQDTGCFVWRNLNKFLEMRPQNRVQDDKNNDKSNIKKIPIEKSDKKQSQSLQQAAIIELEVIQSGQISNIAQKQILDAPITEVKPIWHCSKDQYFSYLAN